MRYIRVMVWWPFVLELFKFCIFQHSGVLSPFPSSSFLLSSLSPSLSPSLLPSLPLSLLLSLPPPSLPPFLSLPLSPSPSPSPFPSPSLLGVCNESKPCYNGAECINSEDGTGYMCKCPKDFYGINCTSGQLQGLHNSHV